MNISYEIINYQLNKINKIVKSKDYTDISIFINTCKKEDDLCFIPIKLMVDLYNDIVETYSIPPETKKLWYFSEKKQIYIVTEKTENKKEILLEKHKISYDNKLIEYIIHSKIYVIKKPIRNITNDYKLIFQCYLL